MNTMHGFMQQTPTIPMATVWLLSDLAEYRGKQELFTKQSPQKLKKLREHALIESAVSSNRIEGVEIDCARVGTVIFGNPWPYVNYLLYTLKELYAEFERRVGDMGSVRGEKTALIIGAVDRFPSTFTVADIQASCPGVSLDLIRGKLKQLKAANRIECLGMGRNARWRRK